MARILYAWELGTGLGHIDRMLGVARELRARDHAVQPVLRDLSRAHGRLGAEGFAGLQAPVWLPQMANPPALNSYTLVLASAGWLDAPGLAGLLAGWRRLFELAGADWLVCDHAPTAMLAARGLGLKVHAVGNSFEIPPIVSAGAEPVFPPLAFWEGRQPERCVAQDALLRDSANRALALIGAPPLARLTDLFAEVHRVVVSVPELAHYDGYEPGTAFVGPSFVGDVGLEPAWPAGDGPRVFAYLTPTHHEFAPLMAALRGRNVRALVFARGLSADAAAKLGGPGLRFETQPLRMDVVQQADLVISHASLGVVSAAALAGKPQLALPNHMEQHMVGRRIDTLGIGRAVAPRSKDNDYPALLRRLLEEPEARAAARALGERLAGQDPRLTASRTASLLEAASQP